MPQPLIVQCSSWENGNLTLLARVRGENGQLVTQASLQSGTVKVVDGFSGAQVGATINLNISAVIFDTLQTDAVRWTVDGTGFNYLSVVPASYFQKAGLYLVQVELVDLSGNAAFAQWENTVRATY